MKKLSLENKVSFCIIQRRPYFENVKMALNPFCHPFISTSLSNHANLLGLFHG